jgi:hypothetical protein
MKTRSSCMRVVLTLLALLSYAGIVGADVVPGAADHPGVIAGAVRGPDGSAADAVNTGQGDLPEMFAGCDVFPANNVWNVPVDTLPVDPNSGIYVATIGAGKHVHADFGSGQWDGGPIGIPYVAVPGTQRKVEVTFYYADESDPGPYPIPRNAPIEGGPGSDGDRHVLVVDRDRCILYELYDAHPQPDGSWQAGSGAIFNLSANALRPATWTSADAAGLPILPGLVRYDEVAAGVIRHALRFTAPQTRNAYIWPARHQASHLSGLQYPPMGQRFRLRADFDVSGFSRDTQVILKALKKYGMILADNGSSWYLSGAPDERWNNDVLHELDEVTGEDFEAVTEASLMVNADSARARTSAPVPNFSATPVRGEAPLAVQFSDRSTGKISAWRWTFGDGQTSSQRNPLHVYQSLGAHTVTLKVTSSDGQGSNGKTRKAYINVVNPSQP